MLTKFTVNNLTVNNVLYIFLLKDKLILEEHTNNQALYSCICATFNVRNQALFFFISILLLDSLIIILTSLLYCVA